MAWFRLTLIGYPKHSLKRLSKYSRYSIWRTIGQWAGEPLDSVRAQQGDLQQTGTRHHGGAYRQGGSGPSSGYHGNVVGVGDPSYGSSETTCYHPGINLTHPGAGPNVPESGLTHGTQQYSDNLGVTSQREHEATISENIKGNVEEFAERATTNDPERVEASQQLKFGTHHLNPVVYTLLELRVVLK